MPYSKIRRILGLLLLLAVTLSVIDVSAESKPPAPSGGKEIQKPKQQPTNHKQSTAKSNKSVSISASAAKPTNIPKPQTDTKPPESKADNKTSEYWWTDPDWWVAIFTGIILLVGGWQVILFRGQLHIMRKSLIDAEEAAKTAKESAEATKASVVVMKDTAERQLRAYVFATKESAYLVRTGTQGEVTFRLFIKNCGQTPAYNVRVRASVRLHTLPLNVPLVRAEIENRESSLTLPGGAEVAIRPIGNSMATDEIRDFDAGTKGFYIFGSVEYKDTFGNPQVTNFRYFFDAEVAASGNGGLSHCSEGNEAT